MKLADSERRTRVHVEIEREIIRKLLGRLNDTTVDWPAEPWETDLRHPIRTMYERVELSSSIVMVSGLSPSFVLVHGQHIFRVCLASGLL